MIGKIIIKIFAEDPMIKEPVIEPLGTSHKTIGRKKQKGSGRKYRRNYSDYTKP